jgi:hypothetical protein
MTVALILAAPVLAVYALIGRLVIPPRERLPLHQLGWQGWLHTLRRGFLTLAACAPPAGIRSL